MLHYICTDVEVFNSQRRRHLSLCLNSYYPSGDAFASGSDDATVSYQSCSFMSKCTWKQAEASTCYSAACTTWGQTERWRFIPKRASYSGFPVLISHLVVRSVCCYLKKLANYWCSSFDFRGNESEGCNFFQSPRTATVRWLQWLHHKCLGRSKRNSGLYFVWAREPRQHIARFPWWDGLLHGFLGPHPSGKWHHHPYLTHYFELFW